MKGTAFGRYRLVSLLGRGGMGEVWRAYDTGTDRMVALKVLPVNFAQDPTFLQRFRREAHAAARLQHPNVVPIHDYGQINGQLFVDMALIEGRDLASVIANGPLEPARAVAVIEQIASALHAAHKAGLVHRDVKPSNVLLDEDDHAYLIDFGIARAAADTKLTGTGATIGTWAYMAPERFMTDEAEPSCDVYALACVLHDPSPAHSLIRRQPRTPGHRTPHRSTTATFDAAPGCTHSAGRRHRHRHGQRPTAALRHRQELATAARTAVTVPTQQGAVGWQRFEPTIPRSADSPTAEAPAGQGRGARRSSRKILIIAAAAILIVAATIGSVMLITRSGPTAASSASLPFTGLYRPQGVAVEGNGTVDVTDIFHDRVQALTTADTETVLPFTGLDEPTSVAVDKAGTRYVTDRLNNRVVALAAEATTQTVLPFTGLNGPTSVAVDKAGTRYVTDRLNNRVVALAAEATTQTVLPFTGLNSRKGSRSTTRASATSLTPPTTGWSHSRPEPPPKPCCRSPDSIDRPRWRSTTRAPSMSVTPPTTGWSQLAAGATTQTVLPFTGLKSPKGVAVDNAGAVYVVDAGNRRVLKLPAS